jgi:hypothetical protein
MSCELGTMKEQILNLFKGALENYEAQIKKGKFGQCQYEEGLCFYFSSNLNILCRANCYEDSQYGIIVEIIGTYAPKELVRGLFHFYPGHLKPRIELIKTIIADIESGKHDDILIEKVVES